MRVKYGNLSPYFRTKSVGDKYLDIMQNRPIPKDESDEVLILNRKYEYRPDLLAFELYGDSRLWWVFAQRNPNTLVDPLFDFKQGTQIWIPKLETLRQSLGF